MKLRYLILIMVFFWTLGWFQARSMFKQDPLDIETLCKTHEKAVVLGCEDSQSALNQGMLECEYMLNVRAAQIETCADQLTILLKRGANENK